MQHHGNKPRHTNRLGLPLKDPSHGPLPWFAGLAAAPSSFKALRRFVCSPAEGMPKKGTPS